MKAGRKQMFSGVAKGNYTKEEIEKKKAAEERMKEQEELQTTPPNHLKGEARREWTRIVKLIEGLPITALDKTVLESYCEGYATFKEMTKDINDSGYWTTNGVGSRVPNPAIKVRREAKSDFTSDLHKLGLSVDGRLKMYIEEEEVKEKERFNLDNL